MALLSQGSREVEQTLRLSRDSIERDIATYRIWSFLGVLVTTFFAGVVREGAWIPTLAFAGALVYAVALRAFIARFGNRRWIASVSQLCDLVVASMPFLLTERFATPEVRAKSPEFTMFILAPGLLLVLFINSLRNSRASTIVGTAGAVAIFGLVSVIVVGPRVPEAPTGVLLLTVGAVGLASARQARKNLDTFARMQLLQRYLPPEAVERVMRDNPDQALSPGGRLVTVTLLAADLRGFTAMSEKLTPTEVMAELNAYHGAMIDVIDRHGGAIDKFIGDGTLVVFGLTGSAPQGARAAVRCAAAMLDALDVHNEERVQAGMTPLAMGIGVHTGAVIAGNLGVPGRRLEFTVIGDAVNTAARLEGQTKASGTPVIVSGATVELLDDASPVRELAPVSIRGKEKALRVYSLAR
jgi:adenylate cyclase